MKRSKRIIERQEAVFTPALHLYYPMAISKGEGSYVFATDGRRYLDFSSGLAVLNIGHCHPHVMAALQAQLGAFWHTGGVYHNETTIGAAERLVAITPAGLDKVFFSNSGAEAIDGALKLARHVTGRQGIIAFSGAFHGRTFGAISVTTSSARYRSRYHPLLPSVFQAPYPYCLRCPLGKKIEDCALACLDYLHATLERIVAAEEVAALLIEPVLGEGGYYPALREFLQGLRSICDRHGILLIFDEVQSGMGRTGAWFAAQHSGVVPDIMTVAKGIASGLPLSAVVARRELMDRWPSGAHGTTFGGNPLACAAAIATIEVIEGERLLEKTSLSGERIIARLRQLQQEYPVIADVRGFGHMIGIELVNDLGVPDSAVCTKVIDHCLEKGIILIPCGLNRNVIRFAPPLNATEAQIDEALAVLADGVRRGA